jgi:hypothetical protein
MTQRFEVLRLTNDLEPTTCSGRSVQDLKVWTDALCKEISPVRFKLTFQSTSVIPQMGENRIATPIFFE